MATSKNVTSNKSSRRTSTKNKPTSQAISKSLDTSGQEEFISRIRVRAYYKAQQRGFAAGNELQDWYEAEQELKEQSAPSVVH